MRRWDVVDYVLPTYRESCSQSFVKLTLARNGNWSDIECRVFGGGDSGARYNLCAIKETLRSLRLADQRGIGGVFAAAAANLLALPDPNDPYAVLKIARGASPEMIKRAYREALQRTHPDRGGNRRDFDRVQWAGRELGATR
jgi:hypothetical protein